MRKTIFLILFSTTFFTLNLQSQLNTNANGNNGIGLNSPNSKLHIRVNKYEPTLTVGSYPSIDSRGDIVLNLQNNNNAFEFGVTSKVGGRRSWILARHANTNFGNTYSTLHLQPDLGDKSKYQGVAIGYPSEDGINVGAHLAINGNVGILTKNPDYALTVKGYTKIGGNQNTQIMLADRGWSASHALLFNSYPSENFVNGGLNVFQNTKYANDEGSNANSGAGGVFFNGNGGVLEFKISKVSTGKDGFVEWANQTQLAILRNGNVGIGVLNGENYSNSQIDLIDHKLTINGKVRAREVKVSLDNWPDYVFEEGYKLPTLTDVAIFISENNHLPNIPSADDVVKGGIYLGDMNSRLLQKIEELTLYTIQQEELISNQDSRLQKVESENAEIKKLLEELLKTR